MSANELMPLPVERVVERSIAVRFPVGRPSSSARSSWMRWVRRVHLFSGLLLLPFVLVYGISGFLLNRGGGGAGSSSSRVVDPELVRGTVLAGLVDGGPWSEELDRHWSRSGGADRVRVGAPRWAGMFVFEGDHAGATHRVVLDPSTAAATWAVTSRPSRERSERLAWAGGDTWTRQAKAAVQRILTSHEVPIADVRIRSGPTLRVDFDDGDVAKVAQIRLQGTDLVVQERDRSSSLPLSSLLTRLHTSHGYPPSFGIRWVWAICADVLALTMVLWAVTGLAMGWQLKRLRAASAAVLALAVALAAVLIAGMHDLFTN